MSNRQDIAVFSGNDYVLALTILDAGTGLPLDLTGTQEMIWALGRRCAVTPRPAPSRCGDEDCTRYTLSASVTKKLTEGDIVITDAAGGSVEITVDAADLEPLCGTFYHEVKHTSAAGKSSTVLYGQALVKRNLIAA
jgi:hypothetical protein